MKLTRSREQIEADIEATMEQMDSFSARLDDLNEELEEANINSDLEEFAKEVKSIQTAFSNVGFTDDQAFQLALYVIN